MKKWIINGIVYCQKGFHQTDICIKDGVIAEIGTWNRAEKEEVYDAKGNYVIPGFVDVHTHGAIGVDVNTADVKGYEKISRFFASQGTTSFLCSILTDTEEQTIWCIKEALKFQKQYKSGAKLRGIHLEGPFLSQEFKGAMPEHLLKEADRKLIHKYQEAAEGQIRYITVSPEVKGVPEIIKEIRKLGITVAIGHSGADYETSWKCIKAGANSCTHIFNAMKLMHQHFPAIAGAALESDIYCEAICDGYHLHPGTVRILLKTKGTDRVVAITDSIMAAGMLDGTYHLGVNTVIVKDGDAKLENGVRAGSTLTMHRALINLKKFTNRPLEELIPILTENPACLIKMFDVMGSIACEKDADFVILNSKLDILDTFVGGEICH